MKKFLLLISICLAGFYTRASHIVGGEINYTYLGNNEYRIDMIIYRDCSVSTGFDNPARVGIFDASGNLLQSLNLTRGNIVVFDPDFTVPCGTEPTDVCVEYTTYTTTVTLPPIPGGYDIIYQRCCRNATILNMPNPDSEGAAYVAHIPGSDLGDSLYINANPVIQLPPPVYACVNSPISLLFSATDADGDSLVYSLCTPWNGATSGNAQPTPANFDLPLVDIPWQTPYNLGNVLGGSPPLTVNAQTGLMVGYPNTLGQFVLSVCVAEYRDGVFLGETKRDMQFNIVDCQLQIISAFSTGLGNNCSETVTFTNGSQGATSYSWNFGDGTTLADTSHLPTPTYVYPGPGTYLVTLTASNPNLPNCTDIFTLPITIQANNVFGGFTTAGVDCQTIINFTDTSIAGQTYSWDFGDPATTTDVSTAENPQYNYPAPGNYNVTLIVQGAGAGCADTVVQTVNVVQPFVYATFTVDSTDICEGRFVFNNSSTGTDSLLWDFGIPVSLTDTSSLYSPTFDYNQPGTYEVVLILTDTTNMGCNDTATVEVTVPGPILLDAGPNVTICNGNAVQLGPAATYPPSTTFQWTPNIGLDSDVIQNPTASPTETIIYTVVATDVHGCTAQDNISFVVNPFPDTNVDTSLTADCDFWHLTLSAPDVDTSAFEITWVFSDSVTMTGPIVEREFPLGDTIAVEVFFINPSTGCDDSLMLYQLLPPPDMFFQTPIPNVFTPNNDGFNDCFKPNILPLLEPCYTMTIFNRWGRKVFETDAGNTCWNGKLQGDGTEAEEGVYFYILNFKGKDYNGSVMLLKGK